MKNTFPKVTFRYKLLESLLTYVLLGTFIFSMSFATVASAQELSPAESQQATDAPKPEVSSPAVIVSSPVSAPIAVPAPTPAQVPAIAPTPELPAPVVTPVQAPAITPAPITPTIVPAAPAAVAPTLATSPVIAPAPAPSVAPVSTEATQQTTQETKSENNQSDQSLGDQSDPSQSDQSNEEDFGTTDSSHDSDLLKNFEGIVRQSNEFSCGPAALATLITQLGYASTENQIAELAPPSQETGVSLYALKNAATQLGYNVVLKKWTVEQLEARLTTSEDPVLIHDIKPHVGGHFSVVKEIKDNMVSISDTEAGNITFSKEDFAKVWTGYAFMIVDDNDPILADTANNVSDEEAKTINGKYVPVYMSSEREGGTSQVSGINFEACIKKALTLSDKTSRNNARTTCYTQLDNSLKTAPYTQLDDVVKNTDQFYLTSPGSPKSDPAKDQTQLSSAVGTLATQLKKDLDTQTQKLVSLQATLQISSLQSKISDYQKSKIDPLQSKINDKTISILVNQINLSGKKNILATISQSLSQIKMQLGSLDQSISAATSNLSQLSKSMQKKAQDLQKTLNTAKQQLKLLQNDLNTKNNLMSQLKRTMSALENTIAQKKARRQNTSFEQFSLNALKPSANATQNSINTMQGAINMLNNSINQLNYQIANSNSATWMQEVVINAAKQQKALKEQEKARVENDKNRLQQEASDLEKTIKTRQDELSVLGGCMPKLNGELNGLKSDLKSKQDQLVAQQAQIDSLKQQLSDELAFIDAQEQRVKNDLKANVDNSKAKVDSLNKSKSCFDNYLGDGSACNKLMYDTGAKSLGMIKDVAVSTAITAITLPKNFVVCGVTVGQSTYYLVSGNLNSFSKNDPKLTDSCVKMMNGALIVATLGEAAAANGAGAIAARSVQAGDSSWFLTGDSSAVSLSTAEKGGTSITMSTVKAGDSSLSTVTLNTVSEESSILARATSLAAKGDWSEIIKLTKTNITSQSVRVYSISKNAQGVETIVFDKTLTRSFTNMVNDLKAGKLPARSIFTNDFTGAVRLPIQSQNYYQEFEVPTLEMTKTGPERLIIGQKGELYYTPDHYNSFIKLN